MENWVLINGYPDYEISDQGQVKSVRYNRLLKLNANNNNYLYVNLIHNKQKKTTAVHKLVIEHFGPQKPDVNHVVDHKDSNKHNNCLDNLEWVSISENTRRAYGNNAQRARAKELRGLGWTMQKIASEIGKSLSFVQDAIHSRESL